MENREFSNANENYPLRHMRNSFDWQSMEEMKMAVNEINQKTEELDNLDIDEFLDSFEQEKKYNMRAVHLMAARHRIEHEEIVKFLEKEFEITLNTEETDLDYFHSKTLRVPGVHAQDLAPMDAYRGSIIDALTGGQKSTKALTKIFNLLYEREKRENNPDTTTNEEQFFEHSRDPEGDITMTHEDSWRLNVNYHWREAILDYLGDHGDEDAQQAIIDFVKKGGVRFHKEKISEALSKINPEKSVNEMLLLLKNQNETVRRDAAKILYRLEFGNVGISEQGVKYLERMYDLGENNNPDYFVRRLTADGDMGVFDENRELAKYFNLGDLTDGQKRIRAQVLDFTYETLFTPRADETPEQRAEREKILEEFKKKYFDFYNDDFFQETGVHFNNLSFREQGWYMHFVENADEETKQRATEFVKKYGEDGFRTFLSMDYGDEMGEKILVIGEKMAEPAAQAVFRKYAEIVDSTKRVREMIEEIGTSDTDKREDEIIQNLLKRGKTLLVDYSEMSHPDKKTTQRVMESLEQINSNVLLFAAALKEVAKEKDFSVQDFVDKTTEIKDSSELSAEEKEQMIKIFIANRPDFSEELLKNNLEKFKKYLEEPGHEFRLSKHNENVNAYLRFDYKSDDRVYAGSFNLSPDAKGTPIALAMARASLQEKGQDYDVEAECYAKNKLLLRFYTRMLGFKEVGRTDEGDEEKELVQLVRKKTGRKTIPKAA